MQDDVAPEDLKVLSTPHSNLHYYECKIILQPQHFTTARAFKEFWSIVRHAAKKCGVKVKEADDAFKNRVREVLFFDTPGYDLYNNHFIVRLRTFYKNGWPEGLPEFTVKFRHPDFATAAAIDVSPATPGGRARIKFKQELLPLREGLGGLRSIYSHNCVLAMPREQIDMAVTDLTRAFPALLRAQAKPDDRITLVKDLAVEEVQVNVGELRFGHGVNAKTTIAVWRNRQHERPICGEFAFQYKFDQTDDIAKESIARAVDFYKTLQLDAYEWITLGTTKTGIVYGLGNTNTTNRE
ncbi:hypothetical protein CKO25_09480 [Thiocapsa imhoffii]|uniref:Uncharacterized protein n=1 Tax=Thiocapsa imhoffii TaxID=382777 RepID=A0A9X0WI19_9GAMM|nr:hypothetical protein [Thiocapsa imhoffii]MBK1644875.1 hypothetical protein [Thiocapsa imhoffii]